MFSIESIFGKKSVLYKIWLISHYEKKLTKNQIAEIDILSAINEILNYKGKISIRISGYLLLGLSRIYYKKITVILSKINERVIKKLNEEKNIDLQDKENHRLTLDLPDVRKFQDYIEQINNDKLQKFDIKMLQCRREDITLPIEKIPSLSLMMNPTQDDKNIPQFEEEVMRSFIGGMENSAYNISHISNMLIEQPDFLPDKISVNLERKAEKESKINEFDQQKSTIELPAERTMFSENLSKSNVVDDETLNNKRKRKRMVDTETMINNETMKLYLNDPSSLIKKQNVIEPLMNEVETPHKIFAIGCMSDRFEILLKDLTLINNNKSSGFLYDSKIEKELQQPLVIPFESHDFDAGIYDGINPSHIREDKIESIVQNITFSHEINQTLDELTTFLISNEQTDFKSFTITDDKKCACRKFVSLLHLHKYEFVHLEQNSPFGSISIIGSPKSFANITVN